MRTFRDVTLVIDEVDTVICNKCSKDVTDLNDLHPCVHISHFFGYGSSKDGMLHEFDLCYRCYDEFIATFQIPVTSFRKDGYES